MTEGASLNQKALAWAQEAFPLADVALERPSGEDLTNVQRAAVSLVEVFVPKTALSDDDLAFKLGTALNGLARELASRNQVEDARQTFDIACVVLKGPWGNREIPAPFQRAIDFAEDHLRGLGFAAREATFEAGTPLLDLTTIVAPLSRPRQTASAGGALMQGSGRVALQEAERGEQDDGADSGPASMSDLLRIHQAKWPPGGLPVAHAIQALKSGIAAQFGHSGLLQRSLGRILDRDLGHLASLLESQGLPRDLASLEALARESRRFAHEEAGPEESRLRGLMAVVANHVVWQIPGGLATNQPQFQIDLMGYIRSILIEHRYNDADRDLLLDCAEAQVRIASNMTPVVLERFSYLQTWLLAAVGTYLMLAGPDPSSPASSYYDRRVGGKPQNQEGLPQRGLTRKERHEWPRILLDQWRSMPEKQAGVCVALAAVAGWDGVRAAWLLGHVYQAESDQRAQQDRGHWTTEVTALMARTERIRIAANPWNVPDSGLQGSVITSDPVKGFRVPNAVLRAAIAQGVEPGETVTVQGQIFAGRRVPTYLLSNRFGPTAILKIDYQEKVEREKKNFSAYARRLHPSHRPSECIAHAMDMYLGENGEPLRAIQTSYVFEDEDTPSTLRLFLQTDTDANKILRDLLLNDLRPWLAHVRRDRIDLRAEYPVLRPAPAPGKQFASHTADGELARLEDVSVCESVQASLNRKRTCTWFDGLPGSKQAQSAWRGDLVNPLWFAAEISESGSGDLGHIIDSLKVGLRDFDTLLALSHGDLHLDNILCTESQRGWPRTVLIDFETAHEGHVCKDLGRLEASILCTVFDWTGEADVEALAAVFAASVHPDVKVLDWKPATDGASKTVAFATSAVAVVREIAKGCGQGHWPIRDEEYLVALFGSLLPMVRHPTVLPSQRKFALLASTLVASSLLARWERLL